MMWPTWSGKTTVLNESGVLNEPGIQYVQSYTTRALRPGEVNGEKYHHISTERFESMIEEGKFLEHAEFSFAYYWTSLTSITEPLAQAMSPIKEMDMQWYLSFCGNDRGIPYVSIFLDIDNQTIIQRVKERGSMEKNYLEARIAIATFERDKAKQWCHHRIDASQPLDHVVKDFLDVLHTEGLIE